MKPGRAMVLAAGLGIRMRPLTDNLPKPLLEVAGRTMLDRALDHLDAAGIGNAVVNCHYLADMIEAHVAGRAGPAISVSREDELLDTGGGVTKALSMLGAPAFYVANADIVWTDGVVPALDRLAAAWRDEEMDALLLLHPTNAAVGYAGAGDFSLQDNGRVRRRAPEETAPLVFTGVQILHPRLFTDAPAGAFSLNRLYDRAENEGRLHGIVHDGGWYHVGTPDSLKEADSRLGGRSEPPA